MTTKDAVVLVPGFLGFSRIGTLYYFADRVAASLRGALEIELRRSVPVVPFGSLPAAGLRPRQRALLDSLAALDRTLSGVERFHLVGHSAGGVDAQLLTSDRPLEGESWRSADAGLCNRIASVTTIASPHWGTGLAASGIASFASNPLRSWAELPSAIATTWDLVRLLPRELVAKEFLHEAHASWPEATRFLVELVRHRELIEDLVPARMERLRAAHPNGRRVPIRSFVTVVPANVVDSSDPFFADLYKSAAAGAGNPPPAVLAAIERLRAPSVPVTGSRRAEVIDATSNDGVVNSARQLVDPSDREELAGIVVADHGDVLGHYDRIDSLAADRTLNAGVFHSGAGFSDDQFFEVYRRVADEIREHAR